MSNTPTNANPYVGPRTFTREQAHLFFGRDQEAEELFSRVVSQRLVLFYAQSGAGKSSLINTRLIPKLEAAGFVVLPVGRVGGDLLGGVDDTVDNIYLFNLMISLDRSRRDPARLAHLALPTFLDRLTTEDGVVWYYDEGEAEREGDKETGRGGEEAVARNLATGPPLPATPNYVLIIDQFEELVTTHSARWPERADFFRQLEAAMVADSALWVVLTLREDFVASLDPYAALVSDKLRARYYMQRMGLAAASEAIRRPADQQQRPFQPEAVELLANNLSQVRVAGRAGSERGQYIEPVQLQVVCYQLWERLTAETGVVPLHITVADVEQAGDVDSALAGFYETTLAAALQHHPRPGGERALRHWFEEHLITEAGTRGTVYQGESETAGLPNALVLELADRFLLRSESRAGGRWIELTHDRFVEPIMAANRAWETKQNNPLAAVTQLWLENNRDPARLLKGQQLIDAQSYAAAHAEMLTPLERDFLTVSLQREQAEIAAARQAATRRRTLIAVGLAALILFALLALWGQNRANEADHQKATAQAQATAAAIARMTAEANTELATDQLKLLSSERLLQEARNLKEDGNVEGAIDKFRAAAAYPNLKIDLVVEEADVRRQAAIKLILEGERLASLDDREGASERFQAALALNPPLDTPVYINISSGEFLMGSSVEDELAQADERPQHIVGLGNFWIMRTEVSNAQYARCVNAGVCIPPTKDRWRLSQFGQQPVTNVNWFQAQTYAAWVGGRLPSEAEWEKGCRGPHGSIFPWGSGMPSPQLLNYGRSGLNTWTNVGNYPEGASYYGVLDMAGNVWEWTGSIYKPYPFQVQTAVLVTPETQEVVRRGGSFLWHYDTVYARCAFRSAINPNDAGGDDMGFRVVIDGS